MAVFVHTSGARAAGLGAGATFGVRLQNSVRRPPSFVAGEWLFIAWRCSARTVDVPDVGAWPVAMQRRQGLALGDEQIHVRIDENERPKRAEQIGGSHDLVHRQWPGRPTSTAPAAHCSRSAAEEPRPVHAGDLPYAAMRMFVQYAVFMRPAVVP